MNKKIRAPAMEMKKQMISEQEIYVLTFRDGKFVMWAKDADTACFDIGEAKTFNAAHKAYFFKRSAPNMRFFEVEQAHVPPVMLTLDGTIDETKSRD